MWATIVAWVAGAGGVAGIAAQVLLKRRSNAKKIVRLAIIRGFWRLFCLGFYARIEARFLRKYPNQTDVANRARRQFEKQLGLMPGPQGAARDIAGSKPGARERKRAQA